MTKFITSVWNTTSTRSPQIGTVKWGRQMFIDPSNLIFVCRRQSWEYLLQKSKRYVPKITVQCNRCAYMLPTEGKVRGMRSCSSSTTYIAINQKSVPQFRSAISIDFYLSHHCWHWGQSAGMIILNWCCWLVRDSNLIICQCWQNGAGDIIIIVDDVMLRKLSGAWLIKQNLNILH